MSKPDYVLKANVIELGLVSIERKLSLYKYIQFYNKDYKLPYNESDFNSYNELWDLLPVEMKEASKINHASYHRRLRLHERIKDMLKSGDDCVFLTITFNDDTLNTTNKETRRVYVRRFLKEHTLKYVANIDYGAKNHREHYHALVCINNLIDTKKWRYGSINLERVRISKDDVKNDTTSKKLSKYICKLVNHAIKEATERNYVIYSKSQN